MNPNLVAYLSGFCPWFAHIQAFPPLVTLQPHISLRAGADSVHNYSLSSFCNSIRCLIRFCRLDSTFPSRSETRGSTEWTDDTLRDWRYQGPREYKQRIRCPVGTCNKYNDFTNVTLVRRCGVRTKGRHGQRHVKKGIIGWKKQSTQRTGQESSTFAGSALLYQRKAM